MLTINSPVRVLCALTLCLTACASPVSLQTPPSVSVIQTQMLAAAKLNPTARVTAQDHSLRLEIAFNQGFQTQALNCDRVAYAQVSVTGAGMAAPIYAQGSDGQNMLPATSGCRLMAALEAIPYGLRVVTVQLFDSDRNLIATSTLKGSLQVAAGTQQLLLSYRQLPTAQVIEALMAGGLEQELFAQTQDLAALQATVDAITGVTGDFPEETYTTHPTLVNVAQLAADLFATTVAAPETYRLSGGSLNVTVTGLLAADQLELRVGDAASAPANLGLAGGTFTGIAPAADLPVTVSTAAGAGTAYTYTLSKNTIDGTLVDTLTITATPATLTLNAPSGKVASGQSLTLIGSNFHTEGATTVTIGGETAIITAVTPTYLTVTVPDLPSVDDQPVVVTSGSQTLNTEVDIYNIYHVRVGASGVTGKTWADAFANPQAALALAEPGDEIRVAEGTYYPSSTGDRTASFVLPEGVTVYGGFDSVAPVANPAQRNMAGDITVLSGEIGDMGLLTDNTCHIVRSANNGVLDGFTITKAYGGADGFCNTFDESDGNGGGLYNSGHNLTLRNLIFTQNHAYGGGAIGNRNGGNVMLEHVVFTGNTANSGGAISNLEDSQLTMTRTVFESNSSISGGGISMLGGHLTLRDSLFIGNSSLNEGGAIEAFNNPNLTLYNVVFSQNASSTGQALRMSGGSLKMVHTTVNGDSMTGFGGTQVALANNLFWQSTLGFALPGNPAPDGSGHIADAQGNIIVASGIDPFVECGADPAGSDGEWFTDDDCLRLRENSAAVSRGVTTLTGISGLESLSIPPLDIRGLSRPQAALPNAGAYEGEYEVISE